MYGDNQYMLDNTNMSKSNLTNKSNTIALHFVQEGSARDEWRTAYINTNINVANSMTNTLRLGYNYMRFIRIILHHL